MPGISMLCFGIGIFILVFGTIAVVRSSGVRIKVSAKVLSCTADGNGGFRIVLEYVDRDGNARTCEKNYFQAIEPGEFVKIAYPGEDAPANKFSGFIGILIFSALWMGAGFLLNGMLGNPEGFDTKTYVRVLGIAFALIGLFVGICTVRDIIRNHRFPVPAVIVDIRALTHRGSSSDMAQTRYHAIAEYTDEHGQTWRTMSDKHYASLNRIRIGSPITLYRNPVSGVVSDQTGEKTAAFVGTAFFIAGIMLTYYSF